MAEAQIRGTSAGEWKGTAGADLSAGEIIVEGDVTYFVSRDADSGDVINKIYEGPIIEVPKATTSGSAIAAGTRVYWDASANQATTSSSGTTHLGYSVEAATDSDSTVVVFKTIS